MAWINIIYILKVLVAFGNQLCFLWYRLKVFVYFTILLTRHDLSSIIFPFFQTEQRNIDAFSSPYYLGKGYNFVCAKLLHSASLTSHQWMAQLLLRKHAKKIKTFNSSISNSVCHQTGLERGESIKCGQGSRRSKYAFYTRWELPLCLKNANEYHRGI